MICPKCKSASGFSGSLQEGYTCDAEGCGHEFKLNKRGEVIEGRVEDEE